MSGGKGGSQTSSVEIPKWLEEPAKRNLARGEQAANIGYMPYYGPDVAALNPTQEAAMANANSAASAFGLAAPMGAGSGLPQAQTFAGGVQGYSSGSLFDQAVKEFERRKPQQAAAYNRLFDQNAMWNNPQQWDAVVSVGGNPMQAGGGTGMSTMTDAQFGSQMAQGATNALALGQMGLIPMSVANALAQDAIAKTGYVGSIAVGDVGANARGNSGGTAYATNSSGGWSDGGNGVGVGGGSVGAGGGNAAGGFSYGGW